MQGNGNDAGNKPRKASDLPKPSDNLTSDAGRAGRAHDMTKKEVEAAIHNIKGKAKVDLKLSGGKTNPNVLIDKQTGDVYYDRDELDRISVTYVIHLTGADGKR